MQKLNKTYVRAEISAEYACHLEKNGICQVENNFVSLKTTTRYALCHLEGCLSPFLVFQYSGRLPCRPEK